MYYISVISWQKCAGRKQCRQHGNLVEWTGPGDRRATSTRREERQGVTYGRTSCLRRNRQVSTLMRRLYLLLTSCNCTRRCAKRREGRKYRVGTYSSWLLKKRKRSRARSPFDIVLSESLPLAYARITSIFTDSSYKVNHYGTIAYFYQNVFFR